MNTTELPCVCGAKIKVELGNPQISNFATFSMATMEHSREVSCPTCSRTVMPQLVGLQGCMVRLVPVAKSEEPKLVIPFGGGKVIA